jgi:signal transduction histidine kinase
MRLLRSLRARLTAAVALLFAVWVALACVGLFAYSYRAADRKAERRLSTAAQEIAEDLRRKADRISPESGPEVIIGVLDQETQEDLEHSDLALLLVDAHGKIAWRSRRAVPPWPLTRGDGWRVVTIPAGRDTVVLGLFWGRVEEGLRGQAVALACLGLLAVVAATLGAWVLVGRTLSPIGLLSRQAREASTDTLQVHLRAPSEDAEVTELVATLNGLLARLAETAAAKGRFHAAASHELRTPLQALSGHLEVALYRERTSEEYQAAIGEALLQTRRLISLAHDLLLLHQIDSAKTRPGEPVDLSEVCHWALRQVAPLLAQRGLRVSAGAMPEVTITAPPTRAEVLVRNLLENAVKYAVPGGEVRLSLRRSGEGACLEVFNECPPVPGWNSASLFEPFARPDDSRSSAGGGSGLGLAICGAIAKANGWTITLAPTGEGVLATVVFCRGDGRDSGDRAGSAGAPPAKDEPTGRGTRS